MFARFKSTLAASLPSSEAVAASTASGARLLQGSEALTHGLSSGARTQLMWWVGGSAAWVYSMVVLGGVTRLTRSGLSMTEWKFTGETEFGIALLIILLFFILRRQEHLATLLFRRATSNEKRGLAGRV